MRGCGYCEDVREAAHELGVRLDERDTSAEPEHLRALVAARGRRTVPVLRVAREGGEDEWMPESQDIIRYLEARFGDGRRARGVALRRRLRHAALAAAIGCIVLGALGVVSSPYWMALLALSSLAFVAARRSRR